MVRVVHGHKRTKGLPIAFNSANICFSFENGGLVHSIKQKTRVKADFKTSPILEKFDPTRETADFGSSQNFSYEVRSSRPAEAGPNLKSLSELNNFPSHCHDSVFQFFPVFQFSIFFPVAHARVRARHARESRR